MPYIWKHFCGKTAQQPLWWSVYVGEVSRYGFRVRFFRKLQQGCRCTSCPDRSQSAPEIFLNFHASVSGILGVEIVYNLVGAMTRGEKVAASQASSFVCEEWIVMEFFKQWFVRNASQTTNIALPHVHGKLQNRPQRFFADAGCNAVKTNVSHLVIPTISAYGSIMLLKWSVPTQLWSDKVRIRVCNSIIGYLYQNAPKLVLVWIYTLKKLWHVVVVHICSHISASNIFIATRIGITSFGMFRGLIPKVVYMTPRGSTDCNLQSFHVSEE